jgi:hypothetical protein
MKRIDLSFLTLAALALLIGVGLGIYMGASQSFQYAPVHAHLNLVGWASLAIFGLTYRAYPALAEGTLAKAHLLASGSGGLLLPLGIYFVIFRDQGLLVFAASWLVLIGVLIFLVQLLRAHRVTARPDA